MFLVHDRVVNNRFLVFAQLDPSASDPVELFKLFVQVLLLRFLLRAILRQVRIFPADLTNPAKSQRSIRTGVLLMALFPAKLTPLRVVSDAESVLRADPHQLIPPVLVLLVIQLAVQDRLQDLTAALNVRLTIRHNKNVHRLVFVLKLVVLAPRSSSSSNINFTFRPFFKDLLRLPPRAQDQGNIALGRGVRELGDVKFTTRSWRFVISWGLVKWVEAETLFDASVSFFLQLLPGPDFSRVDSLPGLGVVDGLWGWRPDLIVLDFEVVGCEAAGNVLDSELT